jgi:hypothetical protein
MLSRSRLTAPRLVYAAMMFPLAFFAVACSSSGDASADTAAAAAANPGAAPTASSASDSAALKAGLEIAQRYHVQAIGSRRFDHDAFWRAVAPSLESSALHTEDIGRSMLGRSIRAVTFGEGKTTVLLWSQMHGDESTATMALADIFRFLTEAQNDSLRERLRHQLTVVFVPMLNPDGAELFQRGNAAGIDINRDARRLATPEARTLKALHDRLHPAFGFNLHDQNARTLAGERGKPAAIALEAPAFSEERSYNDVRSHARLVAATIAGILSAEIPGRIAKYDETFNPRAFGDNLQKWGTSTVLIESGYLPNDPEKQRLRALNVAAILGALDAIATGHYANADSEAYERLPSNSGGASNVLILGGSLVLPGQSPMRADVAINYRDAVAHTGPTIRAVGDLQDEFALDTVDATGLFLHPTRASLYQRNGGTWLRIGAPAAIELRRGAEPSSPLVKTISGGAEGGQRD